MFTFPSSTSHLFISIVIFGDFCDNWFRRKNYHVRSPANRFSPRSGILGIWSTKFENHQSLLAIFFGTDLGFTWACKISMSTAKHLFTADHEVFLSTQWMTIQVCFVSTVCPCYWCRTKFSSSPAGISLSVFLQTLWFIPWARL